MIKKQPFLKRIRLKNFYLFEELDALIPPGVTILTGRNGVGKSLLLDAIRLGFGLNPRSVRMAELSDYIRQKAQVATIELELYNPIVNGSRMMYSDIPDFDQRYFNHDTVVVRRTIERNGSYFALQRIEDRDWVTLNDDEGAELQNLLGRIGIEPEDPLAFVPAEDFMPLVEQDPNTRFRDLVKKLGLLEAASKYRDIIDGIKRKMKERDSFKSRLEIARVTLENLETQYQQFLAMKEIEQTIITLEIEKAWTPIDNLEGRLEARKKRLSNVEDEIRVIGEDYKNLALHEKELSHERDRIEKEAREKREVEERKNSEFMRSKIELENLNNTLKSDRQELGREQGSLKQKLSQINEIESKLATLSSFSPEIVMKELSERKTKLLDKKNKLEKQLELTEKKKAEYYQNEIEPHRKRATELRLEYQNLNEKFYKLKTRKELVSKDKKPGTHYRASTLAFNETIQDSNYQDRILGPVGAISRCFREHEDWTFATSIAIGGLLEDFVALDEDVLQWADRVRRENRLRVNIGFVKRGDRAEFQSLPSDVKDNPLVKDWAYNMVDAPSEIVKYIQTWSGNRILVNDAKILDIKSLCNKMPGKMVVTQKGYSTQARKGTFRSSYPRDRIVHLGTPITGSLSIDDDPELSLIKVQMENLKKQIEEEERSFKAKKEYDTEYLSLENFLTEGNRKIGRIENEIASLESEIADKDPSKRIADLQKKRNEQTIEVAMHKENFKRLKQKIENTQVEIKRKIETVGELDRQIQQIKRDRNSLDRIRNERTEKYVEIRQKLDSTNKQQEILKEEEQKLKSEETKINSELQDRLKEVKSKYPDRPKKIRTLETLKELSNDYQRRLNEMKTDGITDEIEEKYKKFKRTVNTLDHELERRSLDLKTLRDELPRWKEQWIEVMQQKIKSIEKIFGEILATIAARGKIEVRNTENPELGEVYFSVAFGNEELRELEQHSSGQKQGALVALVIALQSQTISPLTAIDELDKGLDPMNRTALIRKIPTMVQKAEDVRSRTAPFPVAQQFIVAVPEIGIKDVPKDLNLVTIARSGDLSTFLE